MKKIGSKVLLMMVLFVVIFGLNTITSVRSQNRVKRSGLEITEQYIPIQTEIFTIQKSMERGQKYLNIISLYDNAELRQQLEGSLAEEVSTITESEKKIDVYLKDNNNTKLKDAIKKYEEFLDKVLLQFSTIQEYVDTGDFAQASIALGSDFQNLVRDMGEKTETNLTENLEGGISEQSKLYNQAVDMNIQVTKILFVIFIAMCISVFTAVLAHLVQKACDLKDENETEDTLKICRESGEIEVTNNMEFVNSLLEVLKFKLHKKLTRKRYVYEKDNVKFEIDDYKVPKAKVVAIEGDKLEVDKVYSEIKNRNFFR